MALTVSSVHKPGCSYPGSYLAGGQKHLNLWAGPVDPPASLKDSFASTQPPSLPLFSYFHCCNLHTHSEIEEEVRHAARNVVEITVAQPGSLWINLLRNPLMYLRTEPVFSSSRLERAATRQLGGFAQACCGTCEVVEII